MKKSFFNLRSVLSKGAMLGTFTVLALTCMTACSDKDMPEAAEEEEVGSEKLAGCDVTVNNDADYLSQFVTNYKTIGSRSRAAYTHSNVEWSMPTPPTAAELSAMSKVALLDWQLSQDPNNIYLSADGSDNWVVPENTTVKANSFSGNNVYNLYIAGTLELLNLGSAQGMNIYILPGGKLNITGKSQQWVWNPSTNNTDVVETLNAPFSDDKKSNLYIYNGGTYTGSYNTASKVGFYAEGDVNVGDATMSGIVRVGGQLTANKFETNNCDLAAADVVAETWTYTNDSKVNVKGVIDVNSDVTVNAQNVIETEEYKVGGVFHMENNSQLYAYQHMYVGKNAEISTQGKLYTPCLFVEDELYIKNSGVIEIPNYIRCDGFRADASGWNITMDANSLINAHSYFTVENKGWALNLSTNGEKPSAVVAEKFQIMEGAAAYINGYATLSAKEYWGKPSENFQYYQEGDYYKAYSTQESVHVTFDGVTISSNDDDCTPNFNGSDTPTPPTLTELVSEINHTHDISATCVALYNGKAYLSWHKRGTSIHGCLEALQVNNDIAQLTSWMEVEDDDTEGGDNWGGNSAVSGADSNGEDQGQFDFNHLVVAEGQVVTVGDNATMGGFIGAIALDGAGNFGTNGTLQEAFKSRQLLGSVTDKVGRSGNAVVYANNKYYLACAGGFQEYEGNIDQIFTKTYYKNGNFKSWAANLGLYSLTAGSAKHIVISGDKVATLELTSKGSHTDGDDYWFNDTKTSIGALLKVRNINDWLNSTAWSVNIGEICPIYGKNAIAMDANGNVYVSAGRQGLLVYNNGNKVGEFTLGATEPDAGANGVAIDNQYVYVAYGIGGLYILNKSDLSIVSWYKSNAPEGYSTQAAAASANYVAVDDQYIYVAYGRHGIKVLKRPN